MIIYPAIDIKAGRAVRLYKGRAEEVTDYGHPLEMARRWQQEGAAWLHVVDLDGAFTGSAENAEFVRDITDQVSIPVQLGGGIRTLADIEERLLRWCVTRVILGTIALENPTLVQTACACFPGRVACGIDAKDGMVAVRGWVEKSTTTAVELALRMRDAGICEVIYTDISRDGTMTGPNVEATAALVAATGIQVIGSGGVHTLEDLIALQHAGCAGAICGKSLYAGAFTLAEALAAVDNIRIEGVDT